jgi:YaiO family outer membrane protein
MNKPWQGAAIILLFTFAQGAAQDISKSPLNSLEVNLRYEHYPQGAERSYLHFQYGRKIGQADIFAKVLRYTLDKNVAYLFETEAYVKFKKSGYSYFDAAWSGSEMLPNYRLRAELFENWKRFEYSMGVGVVKPHVYDAIPLLTGTLGYYFSDYFVYARPTFSYVDDGFSKSLFLQGRRYFNKTDFLALSVLRGADTGTNRNINAIANTFGLDTYMARINGQVKKGPYKFGAGFDYGGIFIPTREDYMNFTGFDVFVNREF